jgi:abortive infection bacteriophage resistance protein
MSLNTYNEFGNGRFQFLFIENSVALISYLMKFRYYTKQGYYSVKAYIDSFMRDFLKLVKFDEVIELLQTQSII